MQKPDAPTQEFAKLLARRLDAGATQFELRLDPPSLGRVEASLRLANNDDSVLVLRFEHLATLDQFSNDQAALRTALSSSGFDLDQQQIVFEHASDTNDASVKSNDDNQYEPLFVAPWTSGAIDIRI